ncbi:Uncharacterised protein [Klebsiella variicola]|uniref:HNH endonuclease n=1 Tax=Klebsiella TaxID=570 RepID=UPI000E2A8C7E|nr:MULTISPECIES: HNH endonuclease [Klebsiella]SXF43162.1 Uncharacterised protein [Klebsiella variicola]
MFKVIRSYPEPSDLKKSIYNSPEIVKELCKIFHGKCYLCEQGDLSDPEVEHFTPHEGNNILKFQWENLFYSCSRCNSIKGTRKDLLLNCTDKSVNVSNEIIHLAGRCIYNGVEIKASSDTPSEETLNTINLLTDCYNSVNTGIRGITKENLMEKIQEHYVYFMNLRMDLVNKKNTDREINNIIEKLEVLCTPSYPFSIFWKWHILTDNRIQSLLKTKGMKINF